MKVVLNCAKAYGKLKGKYRWHISANHAIVGIVETSHGRLTTTELAKILFRGTMNIPARSMFADYVKENKEFLYKVMRKNCTVTKQSSDNSNYIADVYVDFNADEVANQVLAHLQSWVRSGVYYKVAVPNAESTIRHKGSDVPLIDTGEFINSLFAQSKVGV